MITMVQKHGTVFSSDKKNCETSVSKYKTSRNDCHITLCYALQSHVALKMTLYTQFSIIEFQNFEFNDLQFLKM